ncbi:AEC family transporter [Sneathiella glossodoripedis]|uniref:AEC family transporter n=1 Tax=Sneathiella glossodoripedis TaxID=418853 RepID=UPI00046F2846|nr:AEC family transporter [Sneathiella glossodoripedis]
MYEILFNIIAPVFICAGLGFIWAKRGRDFHMETVTGLVTNIGAPMLIFSTLVQLESGLSKFLEFGFIALVSLLTFMVLGFIILKVMKLEYRDFLPALMFPNTGNMGVPLCLFAFGEEGLALSLAFFATYAILQFTLGVWLSSGSTSVTQLLKTPLLYAVLIALAVQTAEVPLPKWLVDTTDLLGGFTIPLMLMALGVSLANLSVQHLKVATQMSVIRLLMGFAVGVSLATLFGQEGAARGVIIIECTMPVAVFNYLFSLRYNRAPGEIAGSILISTALSFATMPLLLLYVLP